MTTTSRSTPDTAERPPLQIGAWRLDPSLGRLARGDDELRLEPKLAALLAVLAIEPGEPVTRRALMHGVWGHDHVTDDALNRLVGRLRKQLARTDLGIETLPRIGYRLVVTPAAEPASTTPGNAQPQRLSPGLRALAALAAVVVVAGIVALVTGPGPTVTRDEPLTVPLTTLPGMEATPAFAPDGTLYFSHRDTTGFWRIHRRASDTSAPEPVTRADAHDLEPAWRADGRAWAFLRRRDGRCAVHVWSIGQPESEAVAECGADNDDSLDWSPAGDDLVFSPPGRGPFALAVLELGSGRQRLVTRPPASAIGDAAAAYSPDGDRLAFVRWMDVGVADVHVLSLADGVPRQVTDDGTKIHGLDWIDERRLVFASDRGGGFGLWQIDLDTGVVSRLPVAAGEVANPTVSADGARIAFESWNDRSNVVALAFGDGAPDALVESTRWDWGAKRSPDGDRLAFISDRSGTPELWISDADGSDPKRVTDLGGPYLRSVDWSPDGAWLVGEASGNDSFDILLIDATGARPPQPLVASRWPERGARWSRSGDAVYFGRRTGRAWSLHRVAIDSGKETTLHAAGGTVALENSTGDALYFTDCLEPGFWRLSTNTGVVEKLLDYPAPLDCQNWRLVDDTAYLVRRARVHDAYLHAYDVSTGRETRVSALPDFHYGGALEVVAGQALYAAVIERESDLMARVIPGVERRAEQD